jgi:UDP-2,3-diacylglucosamine pyrophosphatase LpxH
MSEKLIDKNLNRLLGWTPVRELPKKPRIVIFSDLHMGNGKRRDDFLKNGLLFKTILKDYYLKNDYEIILNGDIEELQRFSLKQIRMYWEPVYDLFYEFDRKNRFYKIIGNHDYNLLLLPESEREFKLYSALRFSYKGHDMLIFHGHQASPFYEKYNALAEFMLKYVMNPLHIQNRSPAYDSEKRYRIEKRVYQFSNRNKMISIIGHTHRPLFESLSKIDFLKFKIEHLCRQYSEAGRKEKQMIEKDIVIYKEEMKRATKKERKTGIRSSLYDSTLTIPCTFNSGSGIGKRGITTIEITEDQIRLVHWFDKRRRKKYYNHYEHKPERLGQTHFFRMILEQDYLDYIFTRIKLLA